MAGSPAATVKAYLAELPRERRAAVQAVRKIVLAHLDAAYEEGMQYGMIGYYVPHRLYRAGYHAAPRRRCPSPRCPRRRPITRST